MLFHISHDDLDGVGSAIMVDRMVGHVDHKVMFCGHMSVDKEAEKFASRMKDDDMLLFTDIAPSETVVKSLIDKNVNFYIMDHHRTNLYLKKYEGVSTIYIKTCATVIASNTLPKTNKFKYTLSDHEKDFVQSVNAWDMWETSSKYRPRGEKLNTLFSFFGIKKFYKMFTENVNTDYKDPFCVKLIEHLEESKNKYIKDTVDNQIKNIVRIDNHGNTYKTILATQYISDIGNEALHRPECEGVSYVAVVCPHNNSVSLRSSTVDVGELAKKMGGGGHAAASGFHRDLKKVVNNYVHQILSGTDDPS